MDDGKGEPFRPYKVPTTNTLIVRVFLEAVAVMLLLYPMLHIYVVLRGDLEPYRRGFFCDDENLKHPNVEEEISVGECVLIWTGVVLVFVPCIEALHFTIYRYTRWEEEISRRDCGVRCLGRLPWVALELYRMLGYFALGALGTLLTTEMAKYKIGRLRPHFLTVCDPELTSTMCKDEFGYEKFVTDYACRGDPEAIREARKSFLSGHSSFSFYCSTFLVIYLHVRLNRGQAVDCFKRSDRRLFQLVFRTVKILRPFIQFLLFALAFYISLTRISDYKHHPMDVVTGLFLGIFFALLILVFLVDLSSRPRSFRNVNYGCPTSHVPLVSVGPCSPQIEEDALDAGSKGDAGVEKCGKLPNVSVVPFVEKQMVAKPMVAIRSTVK